MKKIFTLIIMVLCATTLFAQAPEKFSYQAVVRNASNALVANTPVGVRVSILQGGVNGTIVYMETQTTVTNANGLITLQIGSGNVQQGNFAEINWANGTYFLKTETDPAGGTNYSVTSTQQLLSVPYALYAKDAGNGFSGDYNDLTNTPEIPTVPTNVSAFTNDAGYITGYTETDPQFNAWDKDYNDLINKPTIPTVPTNVSAFTNDAGYLTSYTEADPQFNAWDKDYNDLINKPVIPTVPTSVSSFTNDAGYLTSYTETDPQFNAWNKDYNDLINIPQIPTVPTNVSAFNNDAGYITNADIPEMPTVPTNVSSFTNDAGYLTSYTETDPNVSAWAKEATKPAYDYSEIANTPEIPTVPTNVSAFVNDVPYLTSFTEQQVLTISNDTIFLTGGSFVKLPAAAVGFSGDYNDLVNTPTIPSVPTDVSAFTNDAGYITGYNETDPQFNAWNKDYNDLINTPQIPTVPTNVSAFTNDAGYVTFMEVQQAAGVPTVVSAFQNDANYITLSDVPAQVNADWTATGGKAQILNKPTLFSGNYNDLINKPTFATVATSGNYNDLSNRPTIPVVPTVVSSFTNDAGYISSYTETDPHFNAWDKNYNDLTNKPNLFSGNYNDLSNKPNLAVVAISGNYNDLSNTPSIPTVPTNVSSFTNDAGYVTAGQLNAANYITASQIPTQVNADWNATSGVAQILNKPTLFSGNYNDLTNKPTIPTVPTNVSSFNNDASYITYNQLHSIIDSIQNIYNSKIDSLNNVISSIDNQSSLPCGSYTVTDFDGHIYGTVLIGTQCWLKQNLRTTRYSDGEPITAGGVGTGNWTSSNTIAYWYYPTETSVANQVDGYMYNRKATFRDDSFNSISRVQGPCPNGWHVPSESEWNILIEFITANSQYNCNGGAAKALASTTGWNTATGWCSPGSDSNLGKANRTGFSALPSGYVYPNTTSGSNWGFTSLGESACFWTSSSANNSSPRLLRIRNSYSNTDYLNGYSTYGYSVRCLRD